MVQGNIFFQKIYSIWTFLAQDLPPSLRDHMNRLGFISEIDGRFYGVVLGSTTDSVTETEVSQELLAVEKQGLDGLVIVSAKAKPMVLDLADRQR